MEVKLNLKNFTKQKPIKFKKKLPSGNICFAVFIIQNSNVMFFPNFCNLAMHVPSPIKHGLLVITVTIKIAKAAEF